MEIKSDLDKGQHFLIDKKILEREVKEAELDKEDKIIEIGAGSGGLTEKLAESSGNVTAFEIDKRFKPGLDKLKERFPNLEVIYGNALDFKWNCDKIVSNISYSLSEPVILKTINENISFLVLIVGENFKEILTENKSKIGFIANLFFKITSIIKVDKICFSPKPRVNSWLIKLERRKPENKVEDVLRIILTRTGKTKNAIIKSFLDIGKTKNQARDFYYKFDKEVLEKSIEKTSYVFLLRLKKELEEYL